MAVLLVDDWAHPHTTSVARATRIEVVVVFIDNEGRAAGKFNPVMIREVYAHGS
jgi:hypothetical protein